MAEEDFPRGRSKFKVNKTQDDESEGNKSKSKSDVQRFSRKRQFADDELFSQNKRRKNDLTVEYLEAPLHNEALCTNVVVLACVRQAYDYSISLSLPGGHVASLPITNISKAYSEKLKEISQQDDVNQSEDFSPADDLFKSGFLVPVLIQDTTDETKKGKKLLTTTCDPALINCNLPMNAVQDGMVLIGNISSVEDHGYRIDIGVKGLQAFLKVADAYVYIDKYHNGQQLSVGMPLWCILDFKGKTGEEIKATHVVNVSVAPQSILNAKIPETANLNAILPGMRTDVVVETSIELGLTVKFFGFHGIIHSSHLPRSSFAYPVGSELSAVILYVHPESKVIHLTALPHLVNFEGGPIQLFEGLKMGDTKKAKIKRVVRKKGLFLQLPDSHKAFAALSQLTDTTSIPDITNFKREQEMDCRVMGFNFIEGLALVTMKKSVLRQKFVSVHDCKVGELVTGIITEVLPNGVLVMLSKRIFSFISSLHLADVPIKHPEKKFEEGMKIKCMVVKIDIRKAKVTLTHKKSLMETKYPLLKDYADIRPCMELEGVISFIGPKSVHVSFLNGVRGFVVCKDMSTENVEDPAALFYMGQVVRCCVLRYSVEEKKLQLSFNLGMPKAENKIDIQEKKKDLTAGMVFQAKIIRTEKEAFRVSLLPDKIPMLLPFCHLSDYHELQELKKMYLKPGHQLDKVTFFSDRIGGIVTMKESFLQAVESEKKCVQNFDDLQSGMLLPAIIKNHQDYGIFVELAGGFIGLCPLRTLTEMQPGNLEELLPPGQSVITRVTKIDKEKSRFLGSLRKSECYEGGLDSSMEYLHTFLKSRSQVLEYCFDEEDELAPYSKLRLGSIVEVTVTSAFKKGILCDVEPGMKAIATHKHLGSVKPVVGNKYEAVVLFVDVLAPCLEVSLEGKLIRAVRSRKDNSKNKVKKGQVLKADLQLIKPDFMLMSLRAHGAGVFVYVPTKQIINDVYGSPAYKEGMYSEVVIKNTDKDYSVGVLKMNDPEKCQKEGKVFKKNQSKHSISVGTVLDARVKNVHLMQMNILTESGVQGRVHITEASDEPKEGKHPLHQYQPHNPVKVKVIGLRDVENQSYLPITHPKANRTLLECTMKESKMNMTELDDLLPTSLKVSIGDEIYVNILQIANNRIWVQVSPLHQGWIDFFHVSDDISVINDVHHHFKFGRAYKAFVIGTDNDNKLILSFTGPEKALKIGSEVNARVSGLKPMECLTVNMPGGHMGMIKEKPLKTDHLGQYIRCRVKGLPTPDSKIYGLQIVGNRQEGPLLENLEESTDATKGTSRKRKKGRKSSQSLEEQTDSGVDISKASSDSESEKKTKKKVSKKKSTLSIEGFSWSGDLESKGEDKVVSDDDDGDDDDCGQTGSRKMRKRRKREEERNIQEHERHQLEGDTELRSVADFDRMVLQSPNSSIVWLRYLAYHAELGEVEKARAVAERALSTITFREEQEKKNIWLAYLNLETMYGNSDDVKKVLERAVAYNEPVEIYLKMCDIFVGADKAEDAEQLYHVITRKFKKDKSVWKSYAQFLYKAGRLLVARNLLQRSLTALDKKDHVEAISKFANLEFAHGDPERGRTMFENLIASYPGRTDIWSVYVDMVTKAGDIEGSRQLLERAVKQKLNTKKLSFLVQKFIKFEETYGTEERVEKVKDLAVTLFDST